MTKPRIQRRKISLDGCWAKIERAKEHRDALDQYISVLRSDDVNCPAVGIKFDAKTGNHIGYVSRMPNLTHIQMRVGLILGDIFHNLRSSLDHLMWQLAWWNTNGQISYPQKVQFPAVGTPVRFAEEEKTGSLREIHPKHRAIIQGFQPYRRFNSNQFRAIRDHPIALLVKRSNTDKHRLLTTTVTHANMMRGHSQFASVFNASDFLRNVTFYQPGFIELNTPLWEIKTDDPIFHSDVQVAGHLILEITFPEDFGRTIVESIDRTLAMVIKIVHEFKPFS